MHIIENYNAQVGRVYCYAAECIWDKKLKKNVKPRISIGHLEGNPAVFVPNSAFASLLQSDMKNQSATEKRERDMIDIVNAKYGNSADLLKRQQDRAKVQTAWAVFSGPYIVFGGIIHAITLTQF